MLVSFGGGPLNPMSDGHNRVQFPAVVDSWLSAAPPVTQMIRYSFQRQFNAEPTLRQSAVEGRAGIQRDLA
jgi:hypothetical protein